MQENENQEFANEEKNEETISQPETENQPTQLPTGMTHAASIAAQNSFDKVVKQIRDASSIAMFIATLNIGLGALFTLISADFISDIFEDTFIEPTIGFAYIIFGLIFLVLSVGIYFRSRLCALAALVAFGVDAFLLISNEGFDADNIFGLIMRGALLVTLLLGLFACIRYHSLRKRYATEDDENMVSVVKDNKARLGGGRIFFYLLVGIVGIVTLIYAASTGTFDTGRGFDRWPEHQFVGITLRVPSANVEEESERIDGIPGVAVIATSETRAVFVELIAYVGMLDDADVYDVTQDELFEFGTILLDSMMRAVGVRDSRNSYGTMAGGIRYNEIIGTNDGIPFAFRSFVVGEDVYIIGIFVERETDMELFQHFFDNVVVGG